MKKRTEFKKGDFVKTTFIAGQGDIIRRITKVESTLSGKGYSLDGGTCKCCTKVPGDEIECIDGSWLKKVSPSKKKTPKKVVIMINVDRSCEMAALYLDKKIIMSGNFWDFHPGCHGIMEYGDFNGYSSLAKNIQKCLSVKGIESEIVIKDYKYE